MKKVTIDNVWPGDVIKGVGRVVCVTDKPGYVEDDHGTVPACVEYVRPDTGETNWVFYRWHERVIVA